MAPVNLGGLGWRFADAICDFKADRGPLLPEGHLVKRPHAWLWWVPTCLSIDGSRPTEGLAARKRYSTSRTLRGRCVGQEDEAKVGGPLGGADPPLPPHQPTHTREWDCVNTKRGTPQTLPPLAIPVTLLGQCCHLMHIASTRGFPCLPKAHQGRMEREEERRAIQ